MPTTGRDLRSERHRVAAPSPLLKPRYVSQVLREKAQQESCNLGREPEIGYSAPPSMALAVRLLHVPGDVIGPVAGKPRTQKGQQMTSEATPTRRVRSPAHPSSSTCSMPLHMRSMALRDSRTMGHALCRYPNEPPRLSLCFFRCFPLALDQSCLLQPAEQYIHAGALDRTVDCAFELSSDG